MVRNQFFYPLDTQTIQGVANLQGKSNVYLMGTLSFYEKPQFIYFHTNTNANKKNDLLALDNHIAKKKIQTLKSIFPLHENQNKKKRHTVCIFYFVGPAERRLSNWQGWSCPGSFLQKIRQSNGFSLVFLALLPYKIKIAIFTQTPAAKYKTS